MIARLGFAIATAWKPDVLILDEVLAVGDQRFRQRCEERMKNLVSGGTTLLFVSHDPVSVQQVCRRGVWLEKGKVQADGPVEEVAEAYAAFAVAG
jgi:ABC-type polysaccharide/polyol phosphate transport system ATPase subunit